MVKPVNHLETGTPTMSGYSYHLRTLLRWVIQLWGLGWSSGPSMERVLVISYAGLFSRVGIQIFPHHHSESCQAQHSSPDTLLYQSREIRPSTHTHTKKKTHGYKSIIVHAKSITVCSRLQFETLVWMALWEKSSPLTTRSPSSCWRKWVTNQNPAGEVFRRLLQLFIFLQ